MRKVNSKMAAIASNSSKGRKQFLYHLSLLIPAFLTTVSLSKFSVHKIIVFFFKSMPKYEISAHPLSRWRKLKELLDVSSSPSLLLLSARLTRSRLHFLTRVLAPVYIWSSLTLPGISSPRSLKRSQLFQKV